MLNAVEDLVKQKGWGVVSVSASSGRAHDELLAALAGLGGSDQSGWRLSSVQVFGVGGSVQKDGPPSAPVPPLLRSALAKTVSRLAQRQAGLLLTIDEMQAGEQGEMREFATALQHITRRELQPLAFVGAALPEIEDTLLADRGMTFLQRCGRAGLGPLSSDDIRLALASPIHDRGGRIDADALDTAVEATAGFPYMVQLVGFHSWEICPDPSSGIKRQHVQAATLEATAVLVDQIIRPVWNGLSPVDKSFLMAMAEDDHHSSVSDIAKRLDKDRNYVNYYRGRLLRAGAVAQAGRGRLRFTHQVMRDWLRRRPF